MSVDIVNPAHALQSVAAIRARCGNIASAVSAGRSDHFRIDRARLDEAQAFLANFQKVDNEKFIAARAEKDKEVVRGQSR